MQSYLNKIVNQLKGTYSQELPHSTQDSLSIQVNSFKISWLD